MSEESKSTTETLNPHSVELGRSAAGKVTVAVKCYAESPMAAYEQAKAVFDRATAENPA